MATACSWATRTREFLQKPLRMKVKEENLLEVTNIWAWSTCLGKSQGFSLLWGFVHTVVKSSLLSVSVRSPAKLFSHVSAHQSTGTHFQPNLKDMARLTDWLWAVVQLAGMLAYSGYAMPLSASPGNTEGWGITSLLNRELSWNYLHGATEPWRTAFSGSPKHCSLQGALLRPQHLAA